MLLSVYAVEKGILDEKRAKVIKVVKGSDAFTLHYKVEGQKYRSPEDCSKKTVTAAEYSQIEVSDDGYLQSGVITRKNNFLIWEFSLNDEA
jgi:hypothetical protein